MAASDWSERTRMLVTVAVAAVVNLLLGGGLYMMHGEYKKQEAIHEKKKKEKAGLEEYVRQEEEKKLEFKTLNERFGAQQRKLPEEEQVAELVTKIADVAQKTHCVNKSFMYQPGAAAVAVGGGGYTQDIWKTRWEADFMSFCKLMNLIEEHFERFIAFENLIISPRNSGVVSMDTKEGQHDISVDLVTYRYRPPTP